MRSSSLTIIPLASALVFVVAGCGPSKEDIAAQERARFALEEKARQDAIKANKAITEMTNRAFRRRTPEEEAKHQAEVQRQVREALDAQKKADAEAAKVKSNP